MVQVVDDEAGQTLPCPGPDAGCEGLLQAQRVQACGRRGAEGRQQACEFLHHPVVQRHIEARVRQPGQAGEQRIRHLRLASVCAGGQQRGVGRDQILEQARLADAGLAAQDQAAPLAHCRVELLALRAPPDQARRPQHGDQRRGRAHRGQVAGGDLLRECGGFAVGRGAEFAAQPLAAALEGGQRRSAVAAQVMQPHHAAMRLFEQGFVGEQALGVGERPRHLVPSLVRRRDFGQPRGTPLAPPFARHRHPIGERRAVRVVECAEQFAGSGLRVEPQRGVGLGQIVGHAVGQLQIVAADHELAAARTLQAEQPLAQAVARLCRCGVRPQQGRHGAAWLAAFQGESCQQRRRLALQRHARGAGTGHGGQIQQREVRCGHVTNPTASRWIG